MDSSAPASPRTNLLGFISYDAEVIDADRRGLSPYDVSPRAVEEIRAIKARIDDDLNYLKGMK